MIGHGRDASRKTEWAGWCLIFIAVLLGLSVAQAEMRPLGALATDRSLRVASGRVLYINSYDASYPWGYWITQGLKRRLLSWSDVELKCHYMRSHDLNAEDEKERAAEVVLELIASWHPDLVMVSDDFAVKYVVEPYLSGTALPVVFCGVNWNLDGYHLATNKNVTGIIEVAHTRLMIDTLTPYAQGNRIGFISGANANTVAEVSVLRKLFPERPVSVYAANHFDEWCVQLKKASREVDLLVVDNDVGIENWDAEVVRRLIYEEVTIPTCSLNGWMAEYCLATFSKSAWEQGWLAAQDAVEILKGRAPSSIPVRPAKNMRVFLNMALAKKLHIVFPLALIENAHFISSPREGAGFIPEEKLK